MPSLNVKDLKALKKDDLIRLLMDLQKQEAITPVPSANHVAIKDTKSRSFSPEFDSQRITSPFSLDSSFLVSQIKTAVSEAVHELKTELRMEYKAQLADLECRFSEKFGNLNQEFATFKEQINLSLRKIESDFLLELQDSEQRNRNVMIFGLPENEDSSPDERKRSDLNRVKLLASELGICNLQVQGVVRLGRVGEKPRPIKVTGLSPAQRSDFLLSAPRIPKLKESLGFRRVFLKPDLSLKQQLVNRELRSELRRRRLGGENVILRNGSIVPFKSQKQTTD